jgi:hypothetical protein
MVSLDDDGNSFKFTRFIQIPSSVSLILLGPLQTLVNNLLNYEYTGTGLLFFTDSKDDVGELKTSFFRECNYILEADVKNHDRTVSFKEILSAGSIILRLIGPTKINFKMVCYAMSTTLRYYVYTHCGDVYRLSASMQTGNKLTSIINTFVCRLRVYILFIKNDDLMSLINNDFDNLVILNCGDDLVLGFKNVDIKKINTDIFILDY